MRLIVGEDEVLRRAELARLLTDEGYDVVATASTAPDLVAATRSLRPARGWPVGVRTDGGTDDGDGRADG